MFNTVIISKMVLIDVRVGGLVRVGYCLLNKARQGKASPFKHKEYATLRLVYQLYSSYHYPDQKRV